MTICLMLISLNINEALRRHLKNPYNEKNESKEHFK